MRKIIFCIGALAVFCLSVTAQQHTEFVGLSLGMTAQEMAARLAEKGLQRETDRELSGRVAGLDMWLTIGAANDTTACDYLMMTTQELQGSSQQEDYTALLNWLKKRYGQPHWEGRVRGQRFARWFVGFDRDVLLIARASTATEAWFYDNHEARIVDYYAILKYCERHPAPGIPYYSARDCAVWKTTKPLPVVRKSAHRKSVRKARHHRARSKHKARRRR